MAEWVEGEIMGHALKNRQPAKLFPMQSKEPKTTWHHDWRGKLVLATLNTGIGVAVLATAVSIYALAHHIH
jgi:hypothetical protein